jgi:hypothetical protein
MMAEPHEPICIYLARVDVRSSSESSELLCFIPAPSPQEAERRLTPALWEEGLELVSTRFMRSYWDYEWTSKKEQKAFDGLAEQAYRDRRVVWKSVKTP